MANKITDITPEYIEENYRLIRLGLAAGSRDLLDGKVSGKVFLESCKLNEVNFGKYIEDVLTRIMHGETPDATFLPNIYTPSQANQHSVA